MLPLYRLRYYYPPQSRRISSDFSRLGLWPRWLSIRRYSTWFRRIIVKYGTRTLWARDNYYVEVQSTGPPVIYMCKHLCNLFSNKCGKLKACLVKILFCTCLLASITSQLMVLYACIYILHTALIVSWRLTILLGEIGRQLVKAPLAAAISPYLISPTHPTHAWNVRWNQR